MCQNKSIVKSFSNVRNKRVSVWQHGFGPMVTKKTRLLIDSYRNIDFSSHPGRQPKALVFINAASKVECRVEKMVKQVWLAPGWMRVAFLTFVEMRRSQGRTRS